MEKLFDKINVGYGALAVALSAVFGSYWYLFAAFLLLNIADYATGLFKARYTGAENSAKGAHGIIKKVGYWVVIAVAFFMAGFFKSLGETVGMDLTFTALFGYFTLATFIINEIRSVLENLVVLGVEVPDFLVKGLKVAQDKLQKVTGEDDRA